LLKRLADPELAEKYIEEAAKDSTESLLMALKDVLQSRFQMTEAAKATGITRETLYTSLSDEGNPTISTFFSVLKLLDVDIHYRFKAKRKGT
jgi:probable addiction module antidote protein